jgi:hypothetical protein
VIVNPPVGRLLLAFPMLALAFTNPVPSLVVSVATIRGVAADESPVAPTAYNWILLPVTGCWPPITLPVKAVPNDGIEVARLPHPVRPRVSGRTTDRIGKRERLDFVKSFKDFKEIVMPRLLN